ncbi:MAG TPA: YtxH domain-containing protein [Ktedonobacterales bacterium]
MNRILLGAAIGAALVYYLDNERGEARRMRASNWISQYVNSDTMEQARQATQATVQQAKSLTGQVTDQVNQLRSGRRSTTTTGASLSNSTKSSASAQI